MSPSMVLLENILQALLTSLLLGGVYGLLCVGLGLIFSIMRVINFAQGEFMMLGMYAAFFAFGTLGVGAALGTWGGSWPVPCWPAWPCICWALRCIRVCWSG